MSELLERPNDMIYSNYDVQVNGMSVNGARDVALYQLDLQDVEKIEISESPTYSYQKNGQGGSINLILRKKDLDDDGRHWGSASLDFSYPKSVAPQFHYNYRSEKFYLSALALCDIYDNTNVSELLTFENNKLQELTTNTYKEKYRSQLANLSLEYNPTKNDKLKLNLSENYTSDKEMNTKDYDEDNTRLDDLHHTFLSATASYEHAFRRAKLIIEANYQSNPFNDDYITPSLQDLNVKVDKQVLAGKVELNAQLLNPTQKKSLKMVLGSNFNYTSGEEDIECIDYRANDRVRNLDPENDTHFVQPYVAFESKIGKLRMKVQGAYQHFNYKVKKMQDLYNVTSNDFTGQAILEWHFNSNRTLRLFGARALQRPSADQLFPFRFYNPNDFTYAM